MPTSSEVFDRTMRALMAQEKPKTLLDIGAGAGKYGLMARNILGDTVETTGIEIDAEWAVNFDLGSKYDYMAIDDASTLFDHPRMRYDMVILGDVIEHMRKSDGIDLLNFLVYRAKTIIVIYPHAFQQDDWQGHKHEAHISIWTEHDFDGFDAVFRAAETMHMVTIKGYHA